MSDNITFLSKVFFILFRALFKVLSENCRYLKIVRFWVGPESLLSFQKPENKEDGASGNKDGNGREKEADVAQSFVFGQNIKERAKVCCILLLCGIAVNLQTSQLHNKMCSLRRSFRGWQTVATLVIFLTTV